jgi:CRP/FNR family transcriptional regulator, polysaccharide utilization system transcription regulator
VESLIMMDDLTRTNGDEGIPFRECLQEEEISLIKANSNVVEHFDREVIIRQNTRTSHILYVKSGLIKVYKEGKHRRSFMLKIATSGEFLGVMSVFGSDLNHYSAAALQRAEVVYIDSAAFEQVVRRNSEFAMQLLKALSREGLYIFEKLLAQSHKQLPGRIADVILYFSEVIFKREDFDFPLTRRELAELAGTTKESFIRTLGEFRNDRIISLDGTRVKINSMKIIHTLSELG